MGLSSVLWLMWCAFLLGCIVGLLIGESICNRVHNRPGGKS